MDVQNQFDNNYTNIIMVCAAAVNITKSNEANIVKKNNKLKGVQKKIKPIEREFSALRSLVPGLSQAKKSDLDVVLEAIAYIQQLENKLKSQSSPALLQAKFLAASRMDLHQCEY
jgi:phosphoglycerate-specific signal transduction histidine kinase